MNPQIEPHLPFTTGQPRALHTGPCLVAWGSGRSALQVFLWAGAIQKDSVQTGFGVRVRSSIVCCADPPLLLTSALPDAGLGNVAGAPQPPLPSMPGCRPGLDLKTWFRPQSGLLRLFADVASSLFATSSGPKSWRNSASFCSLRVGFRPVPFPS